jgi:HlyD family secretion protein
VKTYEKLDEMLRLTNRCFAFWRAPIRGLPTIQMETRAHMKFSNVRPRQILVAVFVALACLLGPQSGLEAAENSGAIGQIVPAGGVISLTGSPGGFVEEVHVAAGDAVLAGAILMTVQSEALTAEHELATAELETARVMSAAQIAAQNHAVEVARARLQDASRELASYRAIGPQSTSANELARLESGEAQARLALQIEQARARTVNAEGRRLVGAAEQHLAVAQAAMEIRAPSDGTVLRVDRRAGQLLTGEPAIHMGDLSTMYVVSQVYEGDLLGLRPGMTARIENATLGAPLNGTIEDISRLIDTRARLGEVRIRLDNPVPANRLVGMEVEVVIAR